MAVSDRELTPKNLGEFVVGMVSVVTKYPIWASVVLIAEIAQVTSIVGEYLDGTITPLEIETRMRVTTVLGMLGGASAEGLVRFAKWTITHKN